MSIIVHSPKINYSRLSSERGPHGSLVKAKMAKGKDTDKNSNRELGQYHSPVIQLVSQTKKSVVSQGYLSFGPTIHTLLVTITNSSNLIGFVRLFVASLARDHVGVNCSQSIAFEYNFNFFTQKGIQSLFILAFCYSYD